MKFVGMGVARDVDVSEPKPKGSIRLRGAASACEASQ